MIKDMIMEIALNADYDTTNNILKTCSTADIDALWKAKCAKLYPSKTYLEAFSGRENFLLKERTFVLTVEDLDDPVISNVLIEYHPMLEIQLKIAAKLTRRPMHHVKMNIEKQFIVIRGSGDGKENSIIFQTDIREECKVAIMKDARIETYDFDHYIIDVNSLTLKQDFDDRRIVEYEWIAGSEYTKPNYDIDF